MAFRIGTSNSKCKKVGGNQKICVLIVDDDRATRRIHSALLNKFGVETQVAENGKEAVDLYRSGASFDLVIMDMEMPVMDGPTATQELRRMGVNSMIVGVTSRGQDSEKQAFMRAGLDDCHVKPLNSNTIASLLQQVNKNH
ncbi:hypothetical protein F0562_013711 [Nyssa sinensis]|uniref:Response regulatory domain-containing protein n=1 Tax=Nyssa sinensis TaxID=561372 RepID=A0A5J4ZNK8_9ASTE|nr:hypothetical protein F0562_013711 [Nyssa sinensis]